MPALKNGHPDGLTLYLVSPHLTLCWPNPPEGLAALLPPGEPGEWSPLPALLTEPRRGRLCALTVGATLIVSAARKLQGHPPSGRPGAAPPLTARQRQVLQTLAAGCTTKEVAARLGLSTRTVRMHLLAVQRRFGTRTRLQTLAQAVRLGLL